jgi:prepilin-type N-terminal cleavage/methylation domain-containing protein
MKHRNIKRNQGFTLIEILVSLFVFSIMAGVVYKTSSLIITLANSYQENTTVSAIADQYLEIARNLPYSKIGTISGNPHGSLPDISNATSTKIRGHTYQIYFVVTYLDDPADGTILLGTDLVPNDSKQIKLYVKNVATGVTKFFLGTVAPKGLENISNAGALSIQVFDAVGQPVPNATINITNTALIPNINLTRTSDSNGNWVEVGLPDSNNSYHVVVTKQGYSTDRTYAITGGNPSPTKPDATILNAQVTQVSFSIDLLSNLVFSTSDQLCSPISNVGIEVQGAKLIGTPNILKFDNNYTSDGAGLITLSSIEWDNYTPALIPGSYMIYGSSPIQQISILPNTSQKFSLILGPKTTNSLLVIVKDSTNGNPIEGANVDLQITIPASDNKITGGSVLSQQDWSGGAGQANWSNQTKYFQDNGGVSVNGTPSGVRLATIGAGLFTSSGTLTSSTYDTGATTTAYTTLTWQPTSQDPATALKFQIATNNDNATWNYVGPDGTGGTYYTVSGNSISVANSGNQYLRYKAFLSTTDSSKTPVLTNANINYVSGCFTPGQVIFPSLTAGSNYNVIISASGYQTKTVNSVSISGYNVLSVNLNH